MTPTNQANFCSSKLSAFDFFRINSRVKAKDKWKIRLRNDSKQ